MTTKPTKWSVRAFDTNGAEVDVFWRNSQEAAVALVKSLQRKGYIVHVRPAVIRRGS